MTRAWSAAPDDDLDVKRAFASVYGVDAGTASGGGVLVAGNVVITCAHVVTSALGREVTNDLAGEQRTVEVAFPYAGGERVRAKIIGWSPAKPNSDAGALRTGRRTWSGDVAILKISGAVPNGARPVRLEHHRLGSTVFSWYGGGEATTPVIAEVQTLAGPWVVLDTAATAQHFAGGFSGAPIWDRAQRAVVGIVVSVEPNRPRGFAITTHEVLRCFTGHVALSRGADDLTEAGAAALEPFREALDAVLAGPVPREGPGAGLTSRRERAEHLVRRLRHSERPVTAFGDDETEALITMALDLRRGMATLAAEACALTRDLRLRQSLTAEALAVRPGELLSDREYALVGRVLSRFPAANLRSAAHHAIPGIHGMPSADGGMPPTLAFLERLSHRRGTVPSLVRALLFLAARVSDDELRDEVRQWCEAVAERVGVAPGAMAERRAEADADAIRGGETLRIQVQLRRQGDGSVLHAVGIHDGAESRSVCADDAPLPLGEVVSCIERVLRGEVPDGVESVMLEFFVDPDDLDLDVDRWILPGRVERMLGVEFEVVLRCVEPRLVNRALWLRSWQRLGCEDAVVIDERPATPSAVYTAIAAAESEVACVVAFASEANRLDVIAGCVYAGVPAVLWPRRATPDDDRSRLTKITVRDRQTALPRAVRRLRGRASVGEDQGGHLALLWDDPHQYPQKLHLGSPEHGALRQKP